LSSKGAKGQLTLFLSSQAFSTKNRTHYAYERRFIPVQLFLVSLKSVFVKKMAEKKGPVCQNCGTTGSLSISESQIVTQICFGSSSKIPERVTINLSFFKNMKAENNEENF